MLDGKRTVVALGPDLTPMLKAPKDGAPAAGLLKARSLASLGKCRGDFCKVKADGVAGWAPAARLWGLDLAPQCR
jgi:SH3-like domain-containing protein